MRSQIKEQYKIWYTKDTNYTYQGDILASHKYTEGLRYVLERICSLHASCRHCLPSIISILAVGMMTDAAVPAHDLQLCLDPIAYDKHILIKSNITAKKTSVFKLKSPKYIRVPDEFSYLS